MTHVNQACRLGLLSAAFTAALLLSSCPGSVFVPLPPGSGQGDYVGRLLSEDETETYGEIEITIDENGVVDGDGTLLGGRIEIEGLLDGNGVLTGFVTDTVNQLGGEFNGTLVSNTLIGDFFIQRPAGEDDLDGLWDAAPQAP